MSTKETGGPAFPQSEQVKNSTHPDYGLDCGMTMRDYFAAKMMPSSLACEQRPYSDYNYSNAAKRAYFMADAMLAERAK